MKRLVFMFSAALSCALSLTMVKQSDAYTYTTLNVPGAWWTYAFGINDTGSVAGYYQDGSGAYGFIAQPGDSTSVPEPSTLLLLGLWSGRDSGI